MKHLFALTVVSLCSTLAIAQATTNWQKSNNADAIKLALVGAVDWKALKCAGTLARNGKLTNSEIENSKIENYIRTADDVYVSEGGTQPLLKLAKTVGGPLLGSKSFTVYVTTLADRKSVSEIKVHFRETEVKSVNVGTIDQPVMQRQSILIEEDIGTCK